MCIMPGEKQKRVDDCWTSDGDDVELLLSFSTEADAMISSEGICLGKVYEPSNWDVVCARGKGAYDHIGNRRFRVLIASHLVQYCNASDRSKKAGLIDKVATSISEAGGTFVKRCNGGTWYQVSQEEVKDKIGHSFRDSMRGRGRDTVGDDDAKVAQEDMLKTAYKEKTAELQLNPLFWNRR